jgi:hypothetical protein
MLKQGPEPFLAPHVAQRFGVFGYALVFAALRDQHTVWDGKTSVQIKLERHLAMRARVLGKNSVLVPVRSAGPVLVEPREGAA